MDGIVTRKKGVKMDQDAGQNAQAKGFGHEYVMGGVNETTTYRKILQWRTTSTLDRISAWCKLLSSSSYWSAAMVRNSVFVMPQLTTVAERSPPFCNSASSPKLFPARSVRATVTASPAVTLTATLPARPPAPHYSPLHVPLTMTTTLRSCPLTSNAGFL